jgi:hypothetical protein
MISSRMERPEKIIFHWILAGKNDGLPTSTPAIRPSVSVTTVTTRIRREEDNFGETVGTIPTAIAIRELDITLWSLYDRFNFRFA